MAAVNRFGQEKSKTDQSTQIDTCLQQEKDFGGKAGVSESKTFIGNGRWYLFPKQLFDNNLTEEV